MHIGSFFGLTAPFIVLFYEQKGAKELQAAASLINNPVDQSFISSAYEELVCFKKYLMKIPSTYEIDVDKSFALNNPLSKCSNGYISDDFVGDTKELQMLIKRYFIISVSKRLVSDSNPQFIDCSKFGDGTPEAVRETIKNAVEEFISTSTFTLEDIDIAVNRCMRRLLDRKNKEGLTKSKQEIANSIIESYSLQQKIKNSFTFMGREVVLSDDEVKIVKYYKSRIKTLDACIEIFSSDVIMENPKIFSLHFRDYLNRVPERIFSEIIHMFKSAGAVVGKEAQIPTIRARALEDLKEFRRLFEENILEYDNEILAKQSIFSLIADEYKDEDNDIRDSLIYSALINAKVSSDTITLDTFKELIKIEEFASVLTMENLNAYFGTNLDEKGWDNAVLNLRQAGIGGLNFFTKSLLYQILPSYSFELTIKVRKCQEDIEKYNYILDEAQAFLDCMLPIGTEI